MKKEKDYSNQEFFTVDIFAAEKEVEKITNLKENIYSRKHSDVDPLYNFKNDLISLREINQYLEDNNLKDKINEIDRSFLIPEKLLKIVGTKTSLIKNTFLKLLIMQASIIFKIFELLGKPFSLPYEYIRKNIKPNIKNINHILLIYLNPIYYVALVLHSIGLLFSMPSLLLYGKNIFTTFITQKEFYITKDSIKQYLFTNKRVIIYKSTLLGVKKKSIFYNRVEYTKEEKTGVKDGIDTGNLLFVLKDSKKVKKVLDIPNFEKEMEEIRVILNNSKLVHFSNMKIQNKQFLFVYPDYKHKDLVKAYTGARYLRVVKPKEEGKVIEQYLEEYNNKKQQEK